MVSKPEPTVAGGLAGALALLRQQGALKETTSESKERERLQKERDLWLADHRRRIAKRDLEKAKLRGGAVRDQAQREWEIKTREQQEARDALQAYANYKPDIKIEYTDEFGRSEFSPGLDVGRKYLADLIRLFPCSHDTAGSLEVIVAQIPVSRQKIPHHHVGDRS